MFFFDPLWLVFAIPGLLLGIWAQIKLSHAYGKYSKVPVESGMTGAEAARRILDDAGLNDMPVEEVPGHLSDHYDPTKRALFLSSENFHRPHGCGGGRGGARIRPRAATSGGIRAVQFPDGDRAGDPIREHGLHGRFLRGIYFPVAVPDVHHRSPSRFFP